MELSICIVSRNTCNHLRACLRSIYAAQIHAPFETIVVDNASTDGSPEMVQQEFPQVHLIRNHENRLFSPANNQAIAASCGRFVHILNSDTEIRGDSLERMMVFLKKHPEAGAVTCRMVNSKGELLAGAAGDYTFEMALLNYTFLGHLFPQRKQELNKRLNYSDWDRSTTREVDWIGDANMMLRREALDAIGGFYDETFKIYYTENEICLRLRRKGYKIYFLAEGEVLHHERTSVTKEGVKKISKIYEMDTIHFYKKYYSDWGAILLWFLIQLTNLMLSLRDFKSKTVLETFLQPAKKKSKD